MQGADKTTVNWPDNCVTSTVTSTVAFTALKLALFEDLLALEYIAMAEAIINSTIVADATRRFVRSAKADGTLEYVLFAKARHCPRVHV